MAWWPASLRRIPKSPCLTWSSKCVKRRWPSLHAHAAKHQAHVGDDVLKRVDSDKQFYDYYYFFFLYILCFLSWLFWFRNSDLIWFAFFLCNTVEPPRSNTIHSRTICVDFATIVPIGNYGLRINPWSNWPRHKSFVKCFECKNRLSTVGVAT